ILSKGVAMRAIHCTIVLTCLSASLALADEWHKSFALTGKADLRVDVTDASVTIRPWDRNEIEARVTTKRLENRPVGCPNQRAPNWRPSRDRCAYAAHSHELRLTLRTHRVA